MSHQDTAHAWWSRLRHQGLLLSPVVMLERFPAAPEPAPFHKTARLRDAYTRFVSTAVGQALLPAPQLEQSAILAWTDALLENYVGHGKMRIASQHSIPENLTAAVRIGNKSDTIRPHRVVFADDERKTPALLCYEVEEGGYEVEQTLLSAEEGGYEVGQTLLSAEEGANQGAGKSACPTVPKMPEVILGLKVCDPACGSASFLVAALHYLADALYKSLCHHRKLDDPDQAKKLTLPYGRPRTSTVDEELGPTACGCVWKSTPRVPTSTASIPTTSPGSCATIRATPRASIGWTASCRSASVSPASPPPRSGAQRRPLATRR